MKKLAISIVSLLISLMTINPAYAVNDGVYPHLQMKIVNTIKGKNFALCLSDTCYFLNNKKEVLDGNKVNSIMMTNVTNMQMYPQRLPKSCQVTVDSNQTLIVSGKLVAKKEKVFLNNMECSVTTKTI